MYEKLAYANKNSNYLIGFLVIIASAYAVRVALSLMRKTSKASLEQKLLKIKARARKLTETRGMQVYKIRQFTVNKEKKRLKEISRLNSIERRAFYVRECAFYQNYQNQIHRINLESEQAIRNLLIQKLRQPEIKKLMQSNLNALLELK